MGSLGFFCCTLPVRGVQAAVSWKLSRKFWFGFLTISVVAAKLLHVYAHRGAVPLADLILWGPTFFVQDIIFLLLAFALTRDFDRIWICVLGPLAVILTSTSFFLLTGGEIHWRQATSFNRDPASINTILTGLTGLVVVEVLFVVAGALSTPWLYNGVERMLSTWAAVLNALFKPLVQLATAVRSHPGWWDKEERFFSKLNAHLEIYQPVPLGDYDEPVENALASNSAPLRPKAQPAESPRWKIYLRRAAAVVPTLLILILRLVRPAKESFLFLSQTVIISPFTGVDSESRLASLFKDRTLDGNTTALTAVPKFDWFPAGSWPGFRDWEKTAGGGNVYLHYSATKDPLHLSNLDQDVLEPLRGALSGGDVNIKHIFVFKMESTRHDVFPLRKNSYLYERIEKSYGGEIPYDAQQRLANLTPTAERLTGVPTGFCRNETIRPYGGIRAEDSYTGGTFTLKSIEATTCGLAPLVADFNHEFEQHIYQPCMPHILDVLSAKSNNSKSGHYTNWPWRSAFMQSITDTYDKQNFLTPALGFKPENIVTVESIDAEKANDTTWTEKKFNFWGYPDSCLASYFRSAINKAERNHERLYVIHLTGLTHHPWDTPGKTYDELVGSEMNTFGRKKGALNRYLNTIGINDRWYQTFLEILEETGVANETLIVMTGDHGISLPEDGKVTPYDNPLVSNFHVPLVFANPRLPPVEVNSPVSSVQILPTLLDLLRTSGSLDDASARAVDDLLPMYEGQSIIRPIISHNDQMDYHQFTVMNTGGSMVAMRSARTRYRLIVPLVPSAAWRFTDPKKDPQEKKPVKSFDLSSLKEAVEKEHGSKAANRTADAARAAAWWVTDNWRRYEYNPSEPQTPHVAWPSGKPPGKRPGKGQ